eukprot:TRINITY_DN1199_c0_g1_i1.p1 TRINITY_DN1199_c0_g1~~TRINITY_DN1199_c0_g1_i1.p1  ORF type:complete len:561 (-),score=160.31 TRINITY_DN1199_c0_g1_i1:82-1737(-)
MSVLKEKTLNIKVPPDFDHEDRINLENRIILKATEVRQEIEEKWEKKIAQMVSNGIFNDETNKHRIETAKKLELRQALNLDALTRKCIQELREEKDLNVIIPNKEVKKTENMRAVLPPTFHSDIVEKRNKEFEKDYNDANLRNQELVDKHKEEKLNEPVEVSPIVSETVKKAMELKKEIEDRPMNEHIYTLIQGPEQTVLRMIEPLPGPPEPLPFLSDEPELPDDLVLPPKLEKDGSFKDSDVRKLLEALQIDKFEVEEMESTGGQANNYSSSQIDHEMKSLELQAIEDILKDLEPIEPPFDVQMLISQIAELGDGDSTTFFPGELTLDPNVEELIPTSLDLDLDLELASSDDELETDHRKISTRPIVKKVEQIPTNILQRLEAIWERLNMPILQRIDMCAKYTLPQHFMNLASVLNSWEHALLLIERRERLLYELIEIFKKTIGIEQVMLSETDIIKATSILETLQKCTKDCFDHLLKVFDKYNDIVTFNGIAYIQKLRIDLVEALAPYYDIIENFNMPGEVNPISYQMMDENQKLLKEIDKLQHHMNNI